MRTPTAATVTAAALALAGCAAATSTTSPSAAPAAPSAAARPAHRHRHRARHRKSTGHSSAPGRSPARPRHPHANGLAVSTASNAVVQRQPTPGSCHEIGSGPYARPDPACTPGALNPQVTQTTIGTTICTTGWTETVRPAESITEQEKVDSMAAYGDSGSLSDYEYDHFVPLELGGATNDPRNLWPEPGGAPNLKDSVENELRHEVCDGQMTLAAARHAIVTNWVALARHPATPSQPAHGPTARAPTSTSHTRAACTVTAAYSARYHDYDVYVHSNQPDETVTVSDSAGRSRSWHTDGAGTADVYFDAPGSAAGEPITARVGPATCSGTL